MRPIKRVSIDGSFQIVKELNPYGIRKTDKWSLPVFFSHPVPKIGGADRDRTGDPLLAKQVLSQLSYSPYADLISSTSMRTACCLAVDHERSLGLG